MRLDEFFHVVRYFPHAAQLKFHASDARFKVLIAGARFGKSMASARETLVLAPGQPAGPVTDTGPAFWRGMVQGMRAALALAEQMERDLDARRTVRAVAQGRQ